MLRRVAPAPLCFFLGTLLVGTTAVGVALQGRGEPTTLRPQPGRKGAPVSLPRGEVLLFEVLQQLANYTGETVCFSGDDSPGVTIELGRAVDDLDEKTAAEILEANGFELSRQMYREKNVYWTRRTLTPPTSKGKILRPGGKDEEEGREASEERAQGGAPRIRMYRAEGDEVARFIVIFETDSKKDAEDAVALLRARRSLK